MITRKIGESIKKCILENKLLLVLGPKGNGRTSYIIQNLPENISFETYDLSVKKHKNDLENLSAENFESTFDKAGINIIREAQNLKNIHQIIEWTLSSECKFNLILVCSFLPDLDNDLIEALKFNNLILTLNTYSFSELAENIGLPQFEKSIEDRLIYGNYSEVISSKENAIDVLKNKLEDIVNEQINAKDRINKKDSLLKLLQYVAFHIGENITYNEIGEKCGLDNETVERYIHLLTKSFVLIQLPAFYHEKKYELKKAFCYFYYDIGIRNAVIRNFNPINFRIDENQLWMNWLISEKIKKSNTNDRKISFYFWITHTKQKIDFIEVKNEQKTAYLFQFDKKNKVKIPKSFNQYYPEIKATIVNKSSYWTFLIK